MRKHFRINPKKTLLIVPLLFALIALGILAKNQLFLDREKATTNAVDTIDYGPPSEEEKAAGDQQKQDDKTQSTENAPSSNTTSNKAVSVVITYAGQNGNIVEVNAFMPNYYQDGTCTITFTRGNQVVSKQTPAYKDATTTICTNPEFARSEFSSAGEWSVFVSYASSNASGKSEVQKIILQ